MHQALHPLKILIVGPVPPPAGGMANQTYLLEQFLRASGNDVEMIAVNAPYKPHWVGRIPGLRALFRLIPYCITLYRGTRSADVVHVMANSGWSWHLFAVPAIWIGHWLHKPLLVNYRGGHAERFFASSWHIVEPSLMKATGILVPSTYLQDIFKKYGKKAEIIPNILDDSRFYPRQAERPEGPIRFIITRNLEAIYDVATAIRCAAILKADYPDLILEIAGSGPEQSALERLCEELQLTENVIFRGRLNLDEMSKLYRRADIMLNPSTVDNSPNSIIEALACGVPIVTTNVGGIPKLVTHGHDTLMTSPSDPQAMSEQVKRVLRDPDLKHRLIENGLKTIEKFRWAHVGQKLELSYVNAIAQKEGAPL